MNTAAEHLADADPQLNLHPLDRATRLTPQADGTLRGHTDAAYANQVGPFGGVTAATLLKAALDHPQRLGDPVALTVNYAGPVADGAFTVTATPLRTNRSTQHWWLALQQGDETVTTATAVFAQRRETWTATEVARPAAPAPDTLPRAQYSQVARWIDRYDLRFVRGALFGTPADGGEPDSVSTLWLRDEPPRPLDFVALASICDAFFPRILIRRPRRVPFGTVSITTHFHADTALLQAQGTAHVLGTARAQHFGRGFHDQSAELWGADGALLATSHQICYFKE